MNVIADNFVNLKAGGGTPARNVWPTGIPRDENFSLSADLSFLLICNL